MPSKRKLTFLVTKHRRVISVFAPRGQRDAKPLAFGSDNLIGQLRMGIRAFQDCGNAKAIGHF